MVGNWRVLLNHRLICSPINPIETPYVGHDCSISRQLLLQSQTSEPLTQILDFLHIACLVELMARLLRLKHLADSLEVCEPGSRVRVMRVTIRVQKESGLLGCPMYHVSNVSNGSVGA
jgi:hypothetical protein